MLLSRHSVMVPPTARLMPDAPPFRIRNQCSMVDRTSVVFHKTHKCSSTTIQNILLRFARKHELNVAMPKTANYLHRTRLFNASMVQGTLPWYKNGLKYDMFCLHNRWNGPEVTKVIKEDSPYFTILRDPISLFRHNFEEKESFS